MPSPVRLLQAGTASLFRTVMRCRRSTGQAVGLLGAGEGEAGTGSVGQEKFLFGWASTPFKRSLAFVIVRSAQGSMDTNQAFQYSPNSQDVWEEVLIFIVVSVAIYAVF